MVNMEALQGDGLLAQLCRRTVFIYKQRIRSLKDMSICVNTKGLFC